MGWFSKKNKEQHEENKVYLIPAHVEIDASKRRSLRVSRILSEAQRAEQIIRERNKG